MNALFYFVKTLFVKKVNLCVAIYGTPCMI